MAAYVITLLKQDTPMQSIKAGLIGTLEQLPASDHQSFDLIVHEPINVSSDSRSIVITFAVLRVNPVFTREPDFSPWC